MIPLATVPQHPRSIPLLLATWNAEPGRLLHQASPSHTPQECMPHHTNSCQRSQIQETLQDTKLVTTSNQRRIWRDSKGTKEGTHKNDSHHNFFCQNSLPDTQVPKHGHSKMCLRILQQGCVRPTSTYVTKGGKDSRQSYETP